jgi:hypothetical protein
VGNNGCQVALWQDFEKKYHNDFLEFQLVILDNQLEIYTFDIHSNDEFVTLKWIE